MRTLSRVGAAALAIAAAAALSSCSAGTTQSSAPDEGVSAPVPAAGSGGYTTDDGGTAVDRSIITTGTATILVDAPIKAADAAAALAEQAGGRVDARSELAPTERDGGTAQVTLRIPADRLESVLEGIKALGTPQTVQLSSDDVTQQAQDLDARIHALQTAITRLTELLGKAGSTSDLITIEQAITDRQAELDSLTAQQRTLRDQVAMSTLTVSFTTSPVTPTPTPGTFWDGLVAGWAGLAAFTTGLLIAVGAIVPWLIPLAIAGGIVWLVLWTARRRRRRGPVPAP